jgi:pyrroline-5-carboxylate reductase
VGEIGRAVVMGLCDGVGKPPEVFLSPRGARTAAELSTRYEGVRVCAGNQEVVDRSEVVIIAVRPLDRHEALAGLRVDAGKTVVNVMAGVGNDDPAPARGRPRDPERNQRTHPHHLVRPGQLRGPRQDPR